MRTISVQEMPNGYELELPSFWTWMKAGMAFTLGAGIVSMFGVLVLYPLFMLTYIRVLASTLR